MPPVRRITVSGRNGKFSGTVLGVAQIIENLKELGIEVGRNGTRRSLYGAAVVFRDEAKRGVTKRYGALQKSIVARTTVERKARTAGSINAGANILAYVSIDSKTYTYAFKRVVKRRFSVGGAKFTEASWKRTTRVAKKGDVASIFPRRYAHLVEFGTRPHMIGKGSHPGAKPKPFMRPAYDSKKQMAMAVFAQKMRMEFEKAVRKTKRRVA